MLTDTLEKTASKIQSRENTLRQIDHYVYISGMNDTNFTFLSIVVVVFIGFFVFGMFHIRKMLEKEQNILKAIMLPLIVGFILAVGLLVVSFALI